MDSSFSNVYNKKNERHVAKCLLISYNLEDQPGPPTNVVALPHSSSSIIISWSPPVGNYSISAYSVHYRQLGNVNNQELQAVESKDTNSRVVSGLLGFTNYSFYVKAYTRYIGRSSEVIVQRTLQDSKLTVFLSSPTRIFFVLSCSHVKALLLSSEFKRHTKHSSSSVYRKKCGITNLLLEIFVVLKN